MYLLLGLAIGPIIGALFIGAIELYRSMVIVPSDSSALFNIILFGWASAAILITLVWLVIRFQSK